MSQYGSASTERLKTCNPNIQKVMYEVINCLPWTDPQSGITIEDCTIVEGHRNEFRQNYLYDTHKSLARWPDSNHNALPSNAVDSMPYHADKPHIHWGARDEMEAFSRLVLSVATALEINLAWGGHWQSFFDGPHYEEIL